MQRKYFLVLSLSLALLLALLLFFRFYPHAEDKAFLDSLQKPAIEKNVQGYLESRLITPRFGGKVFCSYDLLGALGVEDKTEVYVWALCEEYYVKEGALAEGTAVSLPVKLVLKDNAIIEHK